MDEEEYGGEEEAGGGILEYFPPIDIDDGIDRPIKIYQELFGTLETESGDVVNIMRFTIDNTLRNGIKAQVISLGAAMVGLKAPDRHGIYDDVVLGFSSVEAYIGPFNPGFGRIFSLGDLPIQLEKTAWEWDFDRDEYSVTFSKIIPHIDVLIIVKYQMTLDNDLIVEIRAASSKISPISLTSQVYWNLQGHDQGEEAMYSHVLTINSEKIWKFYNYYINNFINVNGTIYDLRVPTMMSDDKIWMENDFDEVYVVSKGECQKMTFCGRLVHPMSCRFIEFYSDQPWMHVNTLNVMPREIIPEESVAEAEYEMESMKAPLSFEENATIDPGAGGDQLSACSTPEPGNVATLPEGDLGPPFLKFIPGKGGAEYVKHGSFTIAPIHDLSAVNPLVLPGKDYVHKMIYKVGIFKKYVRKLKKEYDYEEMGEEEEEGLEDICDL